MDGIQHSDGEESGDDKYTEAEIRELAKDEADALREIRETIEEHEDDLRPDARNQLQRTVERHLTHATTTVEEL